MNVDVRLFTLEDRLDKLTELVRSHQGEFEKWRGEMEAIKKFVEGMAVKIIRQGGNSP
jgi:hypothetical protein